MACTTLTRVPPATSLPQSSNSDSVSSHVLSTVLEQSINQGLSRLVQLHEKFIEAQGQVMQNHIKQIEAEQSKLRILLEGQQQKSATLEQNEEQEAEQIAEQHRQAEEYHKAATKNSLAAGIQALNIHNLPNHWPSEAEESPYEDQLRVFSRCRHFVQSPRFDELTCIVLFSNLVCMCIEMEWRSYQVAKLMGDRDNDNNWNQVKHFFTNLEIGFSIFYLLELALRIYAHRCAYFCMPINVIDGLVVCVTFIYTVLLTPLDIVDASPRFVLVRFIKMARVFRLSKVVRFAQACAELRILARAVTASLRSMFWSFFLLAGIISAGGIFIFQFLVGYVEDESNPLEQRRWVYDNFGSMSLSIMAMFEATFTGSWFRFSRRSIMEINGYLSIFWIAYIVVINFAFTRLIGALFLKQTLEVAASDAEKMTMIKLKEKQKFADQIRAVFSEADQSGDGTISAQEFELMLHDAQVGKCFKKLELTVAEVATLFQLTAADDGQADYEEFLSGALGLKNSAKAIDVIMILHASQTMQKQLEKVYNQVCGITSRIEKTLQMKSRR